MCSDRRCSPLRILGHITKPYINEHVVLLCILKQHFEGALKLRFLISFVVQFGPASVGKRLDRLHRESGVVLAHMVLDLPPDGLNGVQLRVRDGKQDPLEVRAVCSVENVDDVLQLEFCGISHTPRQKDNFVLHGGE